MTNVDHKPGDFRLASTAGPLGVAIRLAQALNRSGFDNYEHVALYVGQGHFIEAEPGGVVLNDHSADINNKAGYFWSSGILFPTDTQRNKIVAAGFGYIGTPYSYLDYYALLAKRIAIKNDPFLSAYIRNYVQSKHHMICSQLVSQCWADGDYALLPNKHPQDCTPGDLCELLESLKV